MFKVGDEKERMMMMMIRDIKRNSELETLSDSPQNPSFLNFQQHSLSPSSSFSNGFSSPFQHQQQEPKFDSYGLWLGSKSLPDFHFGNKNVNGKILVDDGFDLCENLRKMHVRDGDGFSGMRRFEGGPDDVSSYNAKKYTPYEGFNKGYFQSFDGNDVMRSTLLDDSLGSKSSCRNNQRDNLFEQRMEQYMSNRPYLDNPFAYISNRIYDEGSSLEVRMIFDEIIDDIVLLMMDPFGNYLVQKLLDVCTEEQRLQIVLMVTKDAGQLVRVCFNTYGTRVVQKLIETLGSRQQISLIMSALEPWILDLIKDLNGNHVLHRCLQCLDNEDNKIIFYAAAQFCVDIATHRHGCCVLQRCISHSSGQHRDNLVTQILRNGLLLAQDPFGNYVVQYIIQLKVPSAVGNLLSQFKGHYVQLSMQKFSSHVVEKCLKNYAESRSQIIQELISVVHFEQLLQDPYANYVIQSALAVTKGPLHATLVGAVRTHMILRTSPYCKRIFSRNLLKR